MPRIPRLPAPEQRCLRDDECRARPEVVTDQALLLHAYTGRAGGYRSARRGAV